MITIITGEKDAGKTRFLEQWYDLDSAGAGFCSPKVLSDSGQLCGYDLLFLPGKKRLPFIRLATEADCQDLEKIVKGRFAFSLTAITAARRHIEIACQSASAPIWIDEIGALELSGLGFDTLFRHALRHSDDIRVVFRKNIVNELIEKYDLACYHIKWLHDPAIHVP